MIHAHRRFPQYLILALFAVILGGGLTASCTRKETGSALRYSHVRTLHGFIGEDAEPFGVAIKDDVVVISDGENGTIRKLDAAGASTVFATGLNTPSAIAFLPNGDLAVADTGSHTIRRVTADGAVSIIAGVDGTSGSGDGLAASATFNAPVGLAVAADGAIYVSDTYNDRIRLIRDGVVSTIAGSSRGFADGSGSLAMFDTPLGIARWGEMLLVADSGNGRIRMVEPNGDVLTLAGGGERGLANGPPLNARFVMPTAVATDNDGRIFIADGNAIRAIGRRIFPLVETLAGDKQGFEDGRATVARFNRPSGLAIGDGGELYVADSENQCVRIVSDQVPNDNGLGPQPPAIDAETKLATRWPYDPPQAAREVAGTLGEIRGEIGPENKSVWFHNGLDIAGAYGETAKFLRDETVLDPHAAENFGTARELLRLPLLGYIHLRLGRDKDDRTFGDARFQFELDTTGKLTGVRVPRGAKFAVGDAIGTLNSMNHVHLIAGRRGHERNALGAIALPGVSDSIAPVIESVSLFTTDWLEIRSEAAKIKLTDKTRIVVRAYDRMDGNSERRRLGVYRVGYQLLSNGSPLSEIEWTIRFDRTPSNDAVRLAYAYGSRSGYTSDTVFNYVATNRVDGEESREDFLDASALPSGSYTLRLFAADFFGNEASKDIEFEK